MKISQLAQSIEPSATLHLNQTAASLKAQGEPVIHLGGGEPLSKSPDSAITGAEQILQTGEIRYGPVDGIAPLKEAIVDYTEQFYGRRVLPDHIIASAGAKQSVMLALQAIVNPGDEVVFCSPYWVSYPDMVRLAGGVPVIVGPQDGLRPRLDDVRDALTPKTKAVILNSPSNPSGLIVSREFVAELVKLCESRGLYLLMDDIYHRLQFDGREPISAYAFSNAAQDDTQLIILNGVSKTYAMTGFRIGWAIANPTVRKAMARIQGHTTSGPCMVSQHAAVGALRGPQDAADQLRSQLERNRDVLVEEFRTIPGAALTPPDATFYCFPDFSAVDPDSMKLAEMILKTVKVVVVPGTAFGLDGHHRISTCGSEAQLREGLARIRWAVSADGPREIEIAGKRFAKL